MADIKTHLRELGVLVGIKIQIEKSDLTFESISNSSFCNIIDGILSKEKHNYYNNIRNIAFTQAERGIIKNAFALSSLIIKKLGITNIKSMDWFGFNTGKDEPYDIEINNLFFSLKENSFILENMGLYKLINCYTGSNYKKRHIFENYAPQEYEQWFNVTWSILIKFLKLDANSWSFINPKNISKKAKILLINDIVCMEYFEGDIYEKCILPINCTLSIFKEKTTSNIREGVFAKFINTNLENNLEYILSKKKCAVVASNALAKELSENLLYSERIARFLRIHKNSYYYAKTTSSGMELYQVPAESDFTNHIKIISITGSVPNTQANILTTIQNLDTGKVLVLRNECRFSHGQFNGTPEAKLYYEHGCSLDSIYNKI